MSSSRAWGLLLLVIAIALLYFGALVWWPIEVDDAFITFRYSQNLVDGLGPVFNAGERVEGYSNPSWMGLLAGAIALGIDPLPASKFLGVAFATLLVFALFREAKRLGASELGAGLAAIFLGASVELQVWSVGGLETLLYSLLFFAGLARLASPAAGPRATGVASALLVAAALTRPEGVAFWAAGAAVACLRRPRDLGFYLLPAVALLLHYAFRFAYYGELLPNTYYAKAGAGFVMWAEGASSLLVFLSNPVHLLWCALAVLGGAVGARVGGQARAVAIFAGAIVCHVAYVVSVGGDGLGFDRFYVPVLAPLALLLSLVLHRDLPAGRMRVTLRALTGAAALAAVAQVLALLLFAELPGLNLESQIYREGKVKLGKHLAKTRAPDTLIAVSAAGAIPYYSGLPTVDMYGLNDKHIARQPFAKGPWKPGHMKWDNAYVLSRKPDLIAINKGYFRAGDLQGRLAAEGPDALGLPPDEMDSDLFRQLAADPAYQYRPIVFPDGSRYFVFERIDG